MRRSPRRSRARSTCSGSAAASARRRAASPRRSSSSTTGTSSTPRRDAGQRRDRRSTTSRCRRGPRRTARATARPSQYRWARRRRARRKHGAVAALVRSVTARSLRTPHTGAMGYDDGRAEDPDRRAHRRGCRAARPARRAAAPVTVHAAARRRRRCPTSRSANVIGELRGREKPDEVVVIGGHIDSWDVGQGAHDDGAGSSTMMQAAALLEKLGLQPRRTIRVVLFTNEENGLRGGKGYAQAHDDRARARPCSRSSPTAAASRRAASTSVARIPRPPARLRTHVGDIASLLARARRAQGRAPATAAPTSGRWRPRACR